MQFGKLEDISGIDFTLPPDHPQTARVLAKSDPTENTLFYHGGTQFGRKEWVGTYIPKKTKSTDYLDFTSRMFNTIELNATHYRIFPTSTIEKWREKVPEGFRFCPKWPQSITHRRRFKRHEDMSEDFLASIAAFGDRLGPCFIQLPPNYTPNHAEQLIDYIKWLPRDLKLAIEFRHTDWFTGASEAEAIFEVMEELGVATCMSDTAGRRDALNMRLTNSFFILRFGGYSLHSSDYTRLDAWIERLKKWSKQGLKGVYIFMHQPDSLVTPETNAYLAKAINRAFDVKVPIPQPLNGQQELF